MTRFELPRRWLSAIAAACLAGLLVAFLEASAVASQHETGGFLSQVGLITPVALLVGALAGAAAILLGPAERVGLLAIAAWDREPEAVRRKRAALALLLIPGACAWLLLGARVGLTALLDGSASSLAGASLIMALGWLLMVGAAFALSRPFGNLLPATARPSRYVASAVAALLTLLVVLVGVGETSGAGGVWSMFGVLRRQELDLRGVGYLALIGASAFQLPSWLRRVPLWAPLGAVVMACGCTVGAARWLDDAGLALATERNTALSKLSLRVLRGLSDRDGDGFASAFGGGDCDDTRADINPMADDVPDNGVDEDCSGADARPLPEPEPEPEAPAAKPDGASLPKDMNIVLVSIDTLRYDIGFTGYERAITPNVDELAAKAVYFEHAYALASYTSKSLGPTLIGRYGSETHRGKLHFSVFEPIDKMVQERLQEAGIYTVSVQGHWYFKENTGLGRGFDVLDLSAIPEERQGEGDRTVNSDKITNAALQQLKQLQTRDERFYMWVHYLDPHAEYVPHEGFDFGDDARARYDGEVAFTDHHVGRLLDAIAASSFADRTAIIVTSDHGEAFGEHGMMRHGFELWDVLVRVPLVIYVPGVKPHRVSVRRSLIDLVPTMLELYGLDVPTRKDEDFLAGRSLLPDILLPPGYTPKPRPIFIDMPGGPFVHERQAFIQEDGQKLITSKLRPMGLYDLEADPGEENNLIKDIERTKAALERMKQFRRQLSRVDY